MEWVAFAFVSLATVWFAISSILSLTGKIWFDKDKKLDRVLLAVMYGGISLWFLGDAIGIIAKMGGN